MKKKHEKKIKTNEGVPAKEKAPPKKTALDASIEALRNKQAKYPYKRLEGVGINPTSAQLAQLAATLAIRKDGPSLLPSWWHLINDKCDKAGKPIVHHPATILAEEALHLWGECTQVLIDKIHSDAEGASGIEDQVMEIQDDEDAHTALCGFGPYPIPFARALELIVGKAIRIEPRGKRFSDFLEYRHKLAGKSKRLMASAVQERFDALKVSGFSMQDFKDVSETYPKWIEQRRAEQARSRGEAGAAGRWSKNEDGTKKK